MILAKRVLINLKSRYRTMSLEQLESLLNKYENDLNNLKSKSNDSYEYLSYSIKQKIKLIQDELNQRNQTVEC